MRKHDVRKWLHAILDLLPVILIPVFMIYSHRHEINDGSIQVQEKQVVDFNQLVKNGNFADNTDWGVTRGSISYDNDRGTVTVNSSAFDTTNLYQSFTAIGQHVYYQCCTIRVLSYNVMPERIIGLSQGILMFGQINSPVVNTYYKLERISTLDDRMSNIIITYDKVNVEDYGVFEISNVMVCDLTQMNLENITTEQFNNIFTDDYYDYTLSQKMLVNKPSLTIYDDTDIMSQLTYQLYNSVDKYFNMGNVFNMTSVYDWFNFNIFGGNAPISIYIVWNIVLYEFVMDLLFLLYALFMWFIDMIEKLMEKPLNSVR